MPSWQPGSENSAKCKFEIQILTYLSLSYNFRVKMNESSLNIDTLTATKVDAKVAGIIFSEVHIVERIEILADKTEPDGIEKLYYLI